MAILVIFYFSYSVSTMQCYSFLFSHYSSDMMMMMMMMVLCAGLIRHRRQVIQVLISHGTNHLSPGSTRMMLLARNRRKSLAFYFYIVTVSVQVPVV